MSARRGASAGFERNAKENTMQHNGLNTMNIMQRRRLCMNMMPNRRRRNGRKTYFCIRKTLCGAHHAEEQGPGVGGGEDAEERLIWHQDAVSKYIIYCIILVLYHLCLASACHMEERMITSPTRTARLTSVIIYYITRSIIYCIIQRRRV